MNECSNLVTKALEKWVNVEHELRPPFVETDGLTNDKSVWFDMANVDLSGINTESLQLSWLSTDTYGRFLSQYQSLLFSIPAGYWTAVKKQYIASLPTKAIRKHVTKLLKLHPELILLPIHRMNLQYNLKGLSNS